MKNEKVMFNVPRRDSMSHTGEMIENPVTHDRVIFRVSLMHVIRLYSPQKIYVSVAFTTCKK